MSQRSREQGSGQEGGQPTHSITDWLTDYTLKRLVMRILGAICTSYSIDLAAQHSREREMMTIFSNISYYTCADFISIIWCLPPIFSSLTDKPTQVLSSGQPRSTSLDPRVTRHLSSSISLHLHKTKQTWIKKAVLQSHSLGLYVRTVSKRLTDWPSCRLPHTFVEWKCND